MYFLSFETSTKIFSLALNKDEKTLRYRNIKSALVLEDSILPEIDKMLDSAGVKFSQIDGFAIGLGPGSFTSLRVGLATVKAFAMSSAKPVVGIPTLDIIASGVSEGAYDEICVLNDARRGKFYSCLYTLKDAASGAVRKTDYLLASLEDILEDVKGRTIFVGDGLKVCRSSIEEAYQKYSSKTKSHCKCLFANEKQWYPQSRVMAGMAYQRFKNKDHDDAAKLLPLYLYPQDCQVSKANIK